MTEAQVRKLLAAACGELGTQRAWAKRYRISEAYLSDVLQGKRSPSDAICRALKIVRIVSYEALR